MSDTLVPGLPVTAAQPTERAPTDWRTAAMQRRIRRRYGAERRFRFLGLTAVVISAGFLAVLLVTMLFNGASGFLQTQIALPVDFARAGLTLDATRLKGPGADLALAGAGIERATTAAAVAAYGKDGARLLSDGAWLSVRAAVKRDPAILATRATIWVPAAGMIDVAAKRQGDPVAEAIVARLDAKQALSTGFNVPFLTASDSNDPTRAGIWGAFKGSLYTMFVTLILAFPIGVLSALYLEEYAPRNRWTDLIEVSINNLAAVPSIIFGLLGLAVFLGTFGLPRSAPIVGGLTLALMTMPVIVIAGRNAIKAVPPSIRDAALGVGASPIQVVFHHVLPLALPGILTGTIIGMARALGETAPLLMIGMRAFIASPPGKLTDPATVLPVQIFLWSDQIDRGFVEKTSAAIIVLLVFLLAMNGFAIYLRNKFETRW
ncbi:phosphate ABC transporter permease PstA [Sphingomonas psychrolutea]|uniref:Phosphate transport system permease protein PstA n=1 Tax=Sphingomonas psychrolutea TaxID=1259676 RepID=A0ABQ1G9I6_9SPHN|nr:phosphate ABC transporter permease PstA [Sphingomonas psychrolutea]GGA39348.1 phosphate transport system permease protein PstA [Sphingomonas psychrolutea]